MHIHIKRLKKKAHLIWSFTFWVLAPRILQCCCCGPVVSFSLGKPSQSLNYHWKEVPEFRTHHKLFTFLSIQTLHVHFCRTNLFRSCP